VRALLLQRSCHDCLCCTALIRQAFVRIEILLISDPEMESAASAEGHRHFSEIRQTTGIRSLV